MIIQLVPFGSERFSFSAFNIYLNIIFFQKREKEILEKRRKEEEERQTRLNEAKNFKVELSEGILKNTVSKEVVKPVPYLPDDFLVYEIPETKSSTSPVSISR